MIWAVMRETAATIQLFFQPQDVITLEAKKTAALLTVRSSDLTGTAVTSLYQPL